MEGNLKGPQLEDEEETPHWKQITRTDPVIPKHHELTHSTHLTFRRPRYSQKLRQEHVSGRQEWHMGEATGTDAMGRRVGEEQSQCMHQSSGVTTESARGAYAQEVVASAVTGP